VSIGVLLMTYGAPTSGDDLPRYLAAVRGGRPAPDELVAEMRRRYERIGGSPLVRITRAQTAALEERLGADHVCGAGMRFSAPTIADAAAHLVARGATHLTGIVLSPQWSPMLMGGYLRALESAAKELGKTWSIAEAWHREPAFVESLAELVREARAGDAAVIFTAHSLPRRIFESEPDYVAQLRETAELVAPRVPLPPDQWRWAYQSAGHTQEEWLRPDLKELFPEVAASGRRDVVVVPVQFLSDHLEVLYDLDIAAADEARAAGLRYRRIAMPNTRPTFISALAAVAHSATPPPPAGPHLDGSSALILDGTSRTRAGKR
jgi:ferrochelatase